MNSVDISRLIHAQHKLKCKEYLKVSGFAADVLCEERQRQEDGIRYAAAYGNDFMKYEIRNMNAVDTIIRADFAGNRLGN